jgi:hypothetical protein
MLAFPLRSVRQAGVTVEIEQASSAWVDFVLRGFRPLRVSSFAGFVLCGIRPAWVSSCGGFGAVPFEISRR